MPATRINHVSIHARDLAASVAFYTDLLGAEPVPTLNHGLPAQWLAVGDSQLHLFERGVEAPLVHHFAVTVSDLEPVYRRAAELGVIDDQALGHHLHLLPGDVAQLYVRDPAGNLVEIDAPGASLLPDDILSEMKPLAERHPQTEEQLRARLNLGL
jgi:catechol 2,3-dioxygenase-like lactoylglutathione lyase family enzyme